jgi:cytochrome c5
MDISFTTIAYGAVVVAGVILFATGTPHERAQEMATAVPAPAAAPAAASAPSVAAAGGVTLQSVSLDLPTSDRSFPGGAAADAINNNCLTCHSAGMVLNQPILSRAAWQAEVDKMRGFYKAPIDPKDVDAIVSYLADLKPAP